jgi:hypothetical protein
MREGCPYDGASRTIRASRSAEIHLLQHLARLFGLTPRVFDAGLICLVAGGPEAATAVQGKSALVVVLEPDAAACARLGITASAHPATPEVFVAADRSSLRMSSLHAYHSYSSADGAGRPVVRDLAGRPVWIEVEREDRRWLVVGTALAADLQRFRQGDPTRAGDRSASAKWDFAFERPNYLFESQLQGLDVRIRHADHWCEAFAAAVAGIVGIPRRPILPGNAPGAIVITGDDDQAYLEKYAAQQVALGGLPITYLMHPQTRHDSRSVRKIFGLRRVELGLHPDALETPSEYATLLAEQSRWFEARFGFRASSVRNHGFLNDGYWGHLPAWRAAGLRISSNIPGLDGKLLNTSLMPGRVLFEGALTEHWSVLTTFGDGMVFALGLSDAAAAARIGDCAAGIRDSRLPGVIVVNLHPQNIDSTRRIHEVLREIARMGFVTWTLADCWRWFSDLDNLETPRPLLHHAAASARRLLRMRT